MRSRRFYDGYHLSQAPHPVTRMLQDERRNAIADLLTRATRPDSRVLIAGCGLGEDTQVVNQPAVALDLSGVAVAYARTAYPQSLYLAADAQDLPFPNRCFDVVVCSEVIEHVERPERMLAEFSRVLHSQGVLVLTTPNWNSLYGLARRFGELLLGHPVTSAGQPIDHWYTRRSLGALLAPFFRPVEWRGVWLFPPVGLGKRTLPMGLVEPLVRLSLPLERRLRPPLPANGHLLAVSCVAKHSGVCAATGDQCGAMSGCASNVAHRRGSQ